MQNGNERWSHEKEKSEQEIVFLEHIVTNPDHLLQIYYNGCLKFMHETMGCFRGLHLSSFNLNSITLIRIHLSIPIFLPSQPGSMLL